MIDRIGHLSTSAYIEWLWLPRIGPSTAWAYRRLNEGLAVHLDGYDVNLETLAACSALAAGRARTAGSFAAFAAGAGSASLQVDERTLAVCRRVSPVTQPQLRHLHPTLQGTPPAAGQHNPSERGAGAGSRKLKAAGAAASWSGKLGRTPRLGYPTTTRLLRRCPMSLTTDAFQPAPSDSGKIEYGSSCRPGRR